jgi:hypothetical protein
VIQRIRALLSKHELAMVRLDLNEIAGEVARLVSAPRRQDDGHYLAGRVSLAEPGTSRAARGTG